MSDLDCSILIHKPDGRDFVPGDTVSGKVTIINYKPIPVFYIKIKWRGEAKTQFPDDVAPNIHTYLNNYSVPWVAKTGHDVFPAGKHEYDFKFVLPFDCPPTYNQEHGCIVHSVEVEVNRTGGSIYQKTLEFVVKNEFSLVVTAPDMFYPAKFRNFGTMGDTLDDGVISLRLILPQCAYAPGDKISCGIEVANGSPYRIIFLTTRLMCRTHIHRRPYRTPCAHTLNMKFTSSNYVKKCPEEKRDKKDFEKDVFRLGEHINISANCKKIYSKTVDICLEETLLPTFASSMISVGYFICISVITSDPLMRQVRTTAQIAIGDTTSLRFTERVAQYAELLKKQKTVENQKPQPPCRPFRAPPTPKEYVAVPKDFEKIKALKGKHGRIIEKHFNFVR